MKQTESRCWLPYAAGVAGKKHEGSRSEDAFFTGAYRLNSRLITLCAVADGMSDARCPYSWLGARAFAQATKSLMPAFEDLWNCTEQDLNNFTVRFRRYGLRFLQRRIEEYNRLGEKPCPDVLREENVIQGENLIQYATTLQVVLAHEDGRVIHMAIGDGCTQIVIGGRISPVWPRKLPERAGTSHITYPGIGDVLCNLRWQRFRLPPQASAILVMSDGGKFPGGLYADGPLPAAGPALEQAVQQLSGHAAADGSQRLTRLLTRLRDSEQNNLYDDLTLGVLIRRHPDTGRPAAGDTPQDYALYQRRAEEQNGEGEKDGIY